MPVYLPIEDDAACAVATKDTYFRGICESIRDSLLGGCAGTETSTGQDTMLGSQHLSHVLNHGFCVCVPGWLVGCALVDNRRIGSPDSTSHPIS